MTGTTNFDNGLPFNCAGGWGGAFRCWIDASMFNQVIFAATCFLMIYAVLMWVYYKGDLKEEDREGFFLAIKMYSFIGLVFIGNFLLQPFWMWLGLR